MNSIYECPPLEDNLKLDELEIPPEINRIILYHGTTSKFLDQIVSSGLKPRNQTGNSVYDGHIESNGELVYLARQEVAEGAASQAMEKFGGDRIVVKIETDVSDLTHDEDVERIFGTTGWKESLRLNGTCAYKGQNPPLIKSITVYEGSTFKPAKVLTSQN